MRRLAQSGPPGEDHLDARATGALVSFGTFQGVRPGWPSQQPYRQGKVTLSCVRPTHSPASKGTSMPQVADSTALNVQPRQRREVYEGLATLTEGRSVKDLVDHFKIP